MLIIDKKHAHLAKYMKKSGFKSREMVIYCY